MTRASFPKSEASALDRRRGWPYIRERFNEAIAAVAAEFPRAVYTPLGDLSRDCYEDPVHFNEKGNLKVAEAFAAVIVNQ